MAHGRERPPRPLWPEGAPGPDPGKGPRALLLAPRVEREKEHVHRVRSKGAAAKGRHPSGQRRRPSHLASARTLEDDCLRMWPADSQQHNPIGSIAECRDDEPVGVVPAEAHGHQPRLQRRLRGQGCARDVVLRRTRTRLPTLPGLVEGGCELPHRARAGGHGRGRVTAAVRAPPSSAQPNDPRSRT